MKTEGNPGNPYTVVIDTVEDRNAQFGYREITMPLSPIKTPTV